MFRAFGVGVVVLGIVVVGLGGTTSLPFLVGRQEGREGRTEYNEGRKDIYIHVYTYTRACTYINLCVYICVHVRVYIYIYIYT